MQKNKKIISHHLIYLAGETSEAVAERPMTRTEAVDETHKKTGELLGEQRDNFAQQAETALAPQVGTEVIEQAKKGNADAFSEAVEKMQGNATALGLLFEIFKDIFGLESSADLRDPPLFAPREEDREALDVRPQEKKSDKSKPDEPKDVPAPDVKHDKSPADALAIHEFKNADARAQNALKEVNKNNWMPMIEESANRYTIPKSLIIAIIEAESSCNPKAVPRDKSGKILSSAKGLSQAIDSTWSGYVAALERQANPLMPASAADRFDPKYAIDFIAWYCKDLETTVNDKYIRPGGYPTKYELNADHPENYYMAYHDGAKGYFKLVQFMEGKIQEDKLEWFQRRTNMHKGVGYKEYNYVAAYALRVRDMKNFIDNNQ